MLEGLKAPFNPADVEFRPGMVTRDKTKAIGLAYVDKRVYEDRLDMIVGAENWTIEYRTIAPPIQQQTIVERGKRQSTSKDYWGNDDSFLKGLDANHPMKWVEWTKDTHKYSGSVLARLTIYVDGRAIVREDVGDFAPDDLASYPTAVAQAFKRACAGFGLGRYLYSLPEVWAEYDANRRKFTDNGMQVLRASLSRTVQPEASTSPDRRNRLIVRIEELLLEATASDVEVEMPPNWKKLNVDDLTKLGQKLSNALK